MAPVTVAGAVAGAAAYGAFKAIGEGDTAAFGAIGFGALGGAGVSATVGGMGLAGGFGAVGIGMGTMAAAGGVVGLGVYGFYKAFKQEPGQRMAGAIDAFERMESKVLEMEAYTQYTQALLELELEALEKKLLGDPVEQNFAALEMEEELEALKASVQAAPSNSFNSLFTSSATIGNFGTNSVLEESPFINPEIRVEVLGIKVEPPQTWKCVKVLKGHKASVNSVAISPDGQTLATGSDDRTVNLWSLKTGKQIFTFFGQAEEIHAVAISPDGQMLVAGGFDNKITSWQLNTKALFRSFFYQNSPYSHSGFISSLAFSQDRKILASASGDKTIRLWGGYTGEIKRTLNGHSDTVLSIAITPDGQIASGSADKTIRLWSLSSCQQPRILTGHSSWVTTVVITPDGNTLVSGSTDGTINLWNLGTGELLYTLTGHSSGVYSITISPNGRTLASGSTKEVKLWNLHSAEDGTLQGSLLHTLAGCSPVAFTPDGKTLVSGGEGGRIKIWHHVLNSSDFTFDPFLPGEWWEVLGVGMDADSEAVKLAYHQLARQYHPDVNRSASAIAKMQTINKAYEEFLKELSDCRVR
jgi:WD40 repeat protein